ncbi:MAG: hypothetical protein U0575_01900 [Phycisphaerales bacterium]
MMITHVLAAVLLAQSAGAPATKPPAPAAPEPPLDWREGEKGILANQTQLTFPDRFIKAGESYFSPDGTRVIFQGVEVPQPGAKPDDFYGMYIAEVVRTDGRITGLTNTKRLSPRGSANTCGWFHPTDPNIVIFASTVGMPSEATPPGYQRGSGRYRWMFPPEMRIVQVDLREADGTMHTLKPLVDHHDAYMAECSISPDGRHVLYCSLESNQGDLFVKDLKTGVTTRIVDKPGYDGGPFFSPDGKRICWRSDRLDDNLLQVFTADLVFQQGGDADGAIVGIGPEHQLTNNEHVNWGPFWHPSGRFQVYATSQVGHQNYEIFRLDADPGNLDEHGASNGPPGSKGPIRYGTGVRRITFASGADVLPAFSRDGRWLIWTSQRGEDKSSQLWVAEWLGDAPKPVAKPVAKP